MHSNPSPELEAFFQEIYSTREKINYSGPNYGYCYYRYQEDASWPIRSQLQLRYPGKGNHSLIEIEKNIVDKFYNRLWDANLIKHFLLHHNGVSSSLLRYAQARHSGIPCRMIDFSLSRDEALSFCYEDRNKDNDIDGAIYILKADSRIENNRKEIEEFNDSCFLNLPYPANSNQKLAMRNLIQQQGKLLLLGSNNLDTPFMGTPNSIFALGKVIVPASIKSELRLRLALPSGFYATDREPQIKLMVSKLLEEYKNR